MFNSILVANRGEIASRVIQSAKRLGIETHTIFHHVDRFSPHVKAADFAHEIFAEVPVSAYLDVEQITGLAKSLKIESLHPGYGFLSENPTLPKSLEESGIVFIGPGSEIMEIMGDKLTARQAAKKADIPIAPSVEYDGNNQDFINKCAEIGYPLVIKASAGGGGKGMHVVFEAANLIDRLKTSTVEAKRYFGDDRVYAEAFIENPRHIEVQILGDGKGNVVHLFERECSIQRRFQKIIEETPAPNLGDSLRDNICQTACKLAKSVNYKNAGTVEFVVGEQNQFYFLEMNTRLQVEHPVTELVCNIDLVKAQLEIAYSNKIPIDQDDIKQKGHAIEIRVCSEDPSRNFAPSTGKIEELVLPKLDDVRYDFGIQKKQTISTDFDSMVGKLICFGPSRKNAISKCEAALKQIVILGIETNLNFVNYIIQTERFKSGKLSTNFIKDETDRITQIEKENQNSLYAVALAAIIEGDVMRDKLLEPYASIGPWRN